MVQLQSKIRPRRLVTAFCLVSGALSGLVTAEDSPPTEGLRRPIAILPMAGTDNIAVVNHRSGTISTVDRGKQAVIREISIGQQLSGGCILPEGRFVVLDDATNELIQVQTRGDSLQVTARLNIPAAPTQVIATSEGVVVVASSWARRLTVVSTTPSSLEDRVTIDLPFAPRQMLVVHDNQVLVGDAFGSWIALVDIQKGTILRSRQLKAAHNISGIAINRLGNEVYLTHQILHDQSTTKPNVHWGDVMSNVVRRLGLDWFVSDKPEETTAADLYYLGHPDQAAGDPQGVLITRTNQFIVGLSGVNQVAISDQGLNHFQRLDVGRRPISMWLDDDHNELFVANYFDDSISVINTHKRRVVASISLGPLRPLTLAEKGERLFYDARLSSDGWYSCHSCHTDGHTNGQRSDTLGDGYHGDPKQVPSLLGVAETAPWAWNGTSPVLEQQVRKSIETTMRGDSPRTDRVQAIAAYLMTLSPPPSLPWSRGQLDDLAVARGRSIFHTQGCADCHQPPAYTTPETYDVGLRDREGHADFNPPSLLGVGHRHRLLHDGSAASIRESLSIHPQGQPLDLQDGEWQDLSEFLRHL